ncbi:hypothetical protein [Aeromonas phage 4_4512]|nr:hypothetical protein [Aeromonas phage 4_4512]
MVHVTITAAITIAAYFLGLHVYASLVVACFYMWREHAQAEQRVISRHYGNKRPNAPWWCGFERRAWTAKGMLDLVLPVTIFTITLMV